MSAITDRLDRIDQLRLAPLDVDTVIYHGHCQDGFFGALAFYNGLQVQQLFPVSAGHDKAVLSLGLQNKKIAMVDVAFQVDTLAALERDGNVYIVLDHHKTSYDTLRGRLPNTHAYFDMEHSGAYIAWQFFFPRCAVPDIVRYVEDRDLWRFALDKSEQVNAGLEVEHPFDFAYWSTRVHSAHHYNMVRSPHTAVSSVLADLMSKGEVLLAARQVQLQSITARAHGARLLPPPPSTEQPVRVVAVNSSVLASDVGNQLLLDYPRHAVAAVYCYDGRRSGWTVSLRSRKGGTDVSVIAKLFGGGGHAAAAGFFRFGASPSFLIDLYVLIEWDRTTGANANAGE